MPTTPHVAPPAVMAKIIQIGESPVESPRILRTEDGSVKLLQQENKNQEN